MQFLFDEALSDIDICYRNFVRTCINCAIITVRNEVAKFMFLQVCVCPQGVPGPGGGIPACTEADPSPERRLLLRAVRILLECILVIIIISTIDLS